MSAIQSFQLEAGTAPEILVLGSIPGVASLEAVQYYAHPRNAFWPIMADAFQFDVSEPYEKRLEYLLSNRVALWDVLGRCRRQGSLDSAIEKDSIEVNPIGEFVEQHSSVSKILLNGGKAASEFKKNFSTLMSQDYLKIIDLPSTSPAYAAMPFSEKRKRWHQALNC